MLKVIYAVTIITIVIGIIVFGYGFNQINKQAQQMSMEIESY